LYINYICEYTDLGNMTEIVYQAEVNLQGAR